MVHRTSGSYQTSDCITFIYNVMFMTLNATIQHNVFGFTILYAKPDCILRLKIIQ